MSNLRWCIYRRATLDFMRDVGIQDYVVGDAAFISLAEPDKIARLRKAAADEGAPEYFA